MYKALNYWVFGGFSGEKTPYEFIDWAARKGLDGVELTIGDCLSFDITEEESRKIAAYAKEKGIGIRTLVSGGGWNCYLASPDAAERAEAMKKAKKSLQIASWMGAETILLIAGATRVAWDPSRPILSYKTVWENTTSALKELIPFAEEVKVNIGLENVWNRFLISPMEWKLFLDQFQSERMGIYFDAGNACLNGRPEDYPEILGSYIKAVHLKNFREEDCAGTLHGFGDDLMDGVVNYKAFFAEMDKIGYKGPYTVEMIPFCRLPDLVLPDQALAEKVTDQFLAL